MSNEDAEKSVKKNIENNVEIKNAKNSAFNQILAKKFSVLTKILSGNYAS